MTGYPGPAVAIDHIEPVPRRVRARLGGELIVDTLDAIYVWEQPFYPQFYLPIGDFAPGVLVDERRSQQLHRGLAKVFGIQAGGIAHTSVARLYEQDSLAGLEGFVRLDWDAADEWFEEDEQIFVHPRSPYTRVDALRSSRAVRIELDGLVLADSPAPVMVFETGLPTRYYLDRTAVNFGPLIASETRTSCPYKGTTSAYWSVRSSDTVHEDLAWTYHFPTAPLLPITGLIAFYNEKVDVYLDGRLQERPVTHF